MPKLMISKPQQAVLLALIKTKVATHAKQVVMAEPLALWDVGKGWVEAEHVEPWWFEKVQILFNMY